MMEAAMAFDPLDALDRLLHRHPQLRSDPDFAPLLAQGAQSAMENIFIIQKILLKPSFTVAVVGCFRPVLSTLVASTVQQLQKLYGRRCSASDQTVSSSTTMHWSLKVHEYAVMALSRILELAPYLISLVLQYFDFAPPPFERLLHVSTPELLADVGEDSPPLLDILRASYRFLHLEAKVFREMWDWSPFLSLLCWLGPKDGIELSPQVVSDVRWCALQVLSVVLRMSDATTRDVGRNICGLSEEDFFDCLMRWEEYSLEIAVEKAGMFVNYQKDLGMENVCSKESDTQESIDCYISLADSSSLVKWKDGACSKFVEICGIELPVRDRIHKSRDDLGRMPFLLTPSIRKNMEAFVLALSQKTPILLEGALGAGKTSLIYEMARLTGNSDVIFIHLDDETDIKMLLGNYVCTEVPGKFRWQAGALTQAVRRGLWVVFEDIDRAPSEIFSALAPLLEDRKLFVPGRGEVIHAAENFQLFSTITRMKFGSTRSENKEIHHLWKRISMDAPGDEELAAIIKFRFPVLAFSAQRLLGTFNMLKDIASQSSVHISTLGKISVRIERQFSTRDLMKWCQRIAVSGLITVGNAVQSTVFKERVYVEALDIFVSAIHSSADRQLIMRAIAEQWDIPLGRVDFFDKLWKPSFQVSPSSLHIGRVTLLSQSEQVKPASTNVFVNTAHAMRSMERIAMCVEQQEPALLVGETGTGKTTLVQHLARHLAVPLVVLNLSQQSDSTELLGGYKPVEVQATCLLLLEEFINLFAATFSSQQNADFLARVQQFGESRKWPQLMKAFQMAVTKVFKLSESPTESVTGHRKRKRRIDKKLLDKWKKFSIDVSNTERQAEAAKTSFCFSFSEGALVKALRYGHWILLDEVNLAPQETLERLSGILEDAQGTISLTERGDINTISRSPNFRIFACMNPATDIGKRDLPFALRNRFTEFYIDEMTDREDLSMFVYGYLQQLLPSPPVEEIVHFYLQVREEANTRLLDGGGQKPHYSLRSLSRSLEYVKIAMPIYGFNRALHDGICMSFLTLLDLESASIVEQLIAVVIFKKNAASLRDLKSLPKALPELCTTHMLVEQFWLERGALKPFDSSQAPHLPFILTTSVKQNLKNLARAVFSRRYPVLLQGPTSTGKTSLIEYLANRTGHHFVRINNHEHTDLQEYLGTYVTNSSGRLVFQDGILVEAVRKGYWIVLDELNLAPPDVLEALNRLLDDNRELFIPEIQQTIKPHPHFMLFATQNPPGLYGGRKVLSRAFRNRFMELHVDNIPEHELSTIIEKRCQIAPSHASKMVDVMKDLQRQRQGSKVFAGKHGYITPRDLFRWAERHKKTGISYEDLAVSGYMLLAERLRDPLEKKVVQNVLESHMHVELDVTHLYDKFGGESRLGSFHKRLESQEAADQFGKVVWTKSMKRLFYLVNECYEHREPTLLVGETGCGKTTVFQLLAFALGQHLRILNCHQNTETSDFIGGYRPARDKESIRLLYEDAVKKIAESKVIQYGFHTQIPSKIEDHAELMWILKQVKEAVEQGQYSMNESKSSVLAEIGSFEEKLRELHKDWWSLFVWRDGALLEAMRNGDLFLVDEISLAEDSVLERLNSVLESKRSLVLAEKGGPTLEAVFAHSSFHLMATMNPGGDFGKKELSPALRNRFTEIWVPPIDDIDDVKSIVTNRLSGQHLGCVVEPLLHFWQWFQQFQESGRFLSLRDLLSWVSYINIAEKEIGKNAAFIHGAFLVLLDGMTFGGSKKKNECVQQLLRTLPEVQFMDNVFAVWSEDGNYCPPKMQQNSPHGRFGIHPFYIDRGSEPSRADGFELGVPTTSRNAIRILRAMQLRKPVLLEGSPGVGKTSLVAALGALSGHSVVRINLSEQTDVMDLFGSDLPVEGGSSGEFRWSDGVFLQALKNGCWVLLDELNLASQSVLEGLNSCLDHRGEVYIPELGRSFKCPQSFRVFACQNPLQEGGGRKRLPKSFLNRFTKVYVDHLFEADFLFIARSLYPSIPETLLQKMVEFNSRLHEDTMVKQSYGLLGSPWEFNLRDILRWSSLIEGMKSILPPLSTLHNMAAYFAEVIYIQRLRTEEDRRHALDLFCQVFNQSWKINHCPNVALHPYEVHVGMASLKRVARLGNSSRYSDQLQLIPGLAKPLESVMHCVEKGWMCSLVGPPKSGKTALIRVLANLTGNELCELSLSNATDTAELLGCFEQHDLLQCWQGIVSDTRASADHICSTCLSMDGLQMQYADIVGKVKDVFQALSAIKVSTRSGKDSLSFGVSDKGDEVTEPWSLDLGAVESLLKIFKKLEELVNMCRVSDVSVHLRPCTLSERLIDVIEREKSQTNAGRFEWVDGPLLRALKRGEWVILDNANLCSPAVLDRLNPLVEPAGTIVINERGLIDGKALVVQAHPSFRLFLTVDPHFGEVSRAMRNRGAEIYLLQSENTMMDSSSQLSKDLSINYQDAKKLVTLSGIPGQSFITSMCNVHEIMRTQRGNIFGSSVVSLRELAQWIQMFFMLLERGANVTWSLYRSWKDSYEDSLHDVERKLFAEGIFHLSCFEPQFVPGGWPNPLILSEYCKRSLETKVRLDGSYVEFILVNFMTFKICTDIDSAKGNTDLYKLLDCCKSWAPYFPAWLFNFFLDPRINHTEHIGKETVPPGFLENIEKILPYAIFWMLEQTHHSDLGLLLHWLFVLSTKLGGNLPIFDRMISVVKKEISHPVAKHLHTALKELNLSNSDGCSNIQHLLSSHHALTSDLVVENKVLLWFQKLNSLRHSLLQWQTEDEILHMAHGNVDHKEQTLIQCSYWYHVHSEKRCMIMLDGVVIWLYPLLVSLREVQNEILASDTAVWNIDVERAYTEVQDCHEAFWKSLQVNCVDIELLWFWCNTTKQSVKQLLEISEMETSLSKAYDNLLHAFEMVGEALPVQKFPKPFLWKYGGHPWILHSREAYEQVELIFNLCNTYWGKKQSEKDFIDIHPAVADKELRRLTLEGASMIVLMDQEACKSKISESGNRVGISLDMARDEAATVFQMLAKRMELEELKSPNYLSNELYNDFGKKAYLEFEKTSYDHFTRKLICSPDIRSHWVDLLPYLNHISLCLEASVLARLLPVAAEELFSDDIRKALALEVAEIDHVIEYSLSCSSRSPLEFVPHYQLNWILSSEASVVPVTNFIHEMLFNWHAALWVGTLRGHDKVLQISSQTAGAAPYIQASKVRLLQDVMDIEVPLKGYYGKLIQLRVALVQDWSFVRHAVDILKDDLARASGVIQQIIFAHYKSFTEKDLTKIHSYISNMHDNIAKCDGRVWMIESLEEISMLLKRSNHASFVSSLEAWLLPSIRLLYGTVWEAITFEDALSKRGQLWILIGQLRLQLLISSAQIDPNAKYTLRYSHISDRLSDVNLQMKVRRESMIMVRGASDVTSLQKLLDREEDLRDSRRSLATKVVPRPNTSNFSKLREEICVLWGSLASPERINALVTHIQSHLGENSSFEHVLKEVTAWQENSESHSLMLLDRFPGFRDIIQPIQLGVYEIKYGVSCVLASRLESEAFGEAEKFVEMLSLLMQYPSSLYLDSTMLKGKFEDKAEQEISFVSPTAAALLRTAIRERFLPATTAGRSVNIERREFLEAETKVAILRMTVLHTKRWFGITRLLDKETLTMLDTTYRYLSELWKRTRSWQRDEEMGDAKSLKVRSFTSNILSDSEQEEQSFKTIFPDFWHGDQDTDASPALNANVLCEEDEQRSLTDNWSERFVLSLQDCLLRDVISSHKELFMCYSPFVKTAAALAHDDEQLTRIFVLSYDTGRTLCHELGNVLPHSIDNEAASGHLMKLGSLINQLSTADMIKNSSANFNIYKDPNPFEIAKILEPLASLLSRISKLMVEWPEHPVLVQIEQSINLLSSLSLKSPVMKVITGLEMILSKAQLWEENASKLYSISGELDELSRWVTRWRKQELESWSTLLDSVDHDHETNADKLWFLLYDLLHKQTEADAKEEIEPLIESLEEFMLHSPLGEVWRRLDHILAFYGHFSYASFLKSSPSRFSLERIRSMLFNIYHYYSHFSPILRESLSTLRAAVDTEMINFIQLYKWEDRSYYSLASSSEKAHRKIHKVMRKYDQLLKRPISEILDQHILSSSDFQNIQDLHEGRFASIPESKMSLHKSVTSDMNLFKIRAEMSLKEVSEMWSTYSAKELFNISKRLPLFSADMIKKFLQRNDTKLLEKISESLHIHIFSETGCISRLQATGLEDIGTNVIVRSAELQKEKSRMVKKKAFIDLLKRLKQIGLSYYKSTIPKDQRSPRSWFLQYPSDLDCWQQFFEDHLSKNSFGLQDMEVCLLKNAYVYWKRAASYYFNNLELLGLLEKKSLVHSKDLNMQEVEVSKRYAEHLLYLQQQQRQKVSKFSETLGALMLITIHSRHFAVTEQVNVALPPQVFTRKWLWKQKVLLDSLCQVSSESLLFFKTCNSLGAESNKYKALCTSILSDLQSVKGSLDEILVPRSTFYTPEDLQFSWPVVASEAMVRLVEEIFQAVRKACANIRRSISADQTHRMRVPGLDPLRELAEEGMKLADKFDEERSTFLDAKEGVIQMQQEPTQLWSAYDTFVKEVLLAIQNLSTINDRQKALQVLERDHSGVESTETIQASENVLEKLMSALRLDMVYSKAMATIASAAQVSGDLSISGDTRVMLGKQIGCMHVLLEIMQAAGLRVFFDYISLHKAVSKLTYILLKLLISLYSKGFCVAQQEEEGGEKSNDEDAVGTGMGEGEGTKDVSDEIEQEDQLVGTQKDKTAPEKSRDTEEKGIEMEDDFSGEMFHISEDESSQGSDSENSDQENIESKMGDIDEKDEIVDERFWNSEDKDVTSSGQEKYEKDAPISRNQSEDVALKGKDEHDQDTPVEEDTMHENKHRNGKDSDKEEDDRDNDGMEAEFPDSTLEGAYEEGSGVKPHGEVPENINLDSDDSESSDKDGDDVTNEDSEEGHEQERMESSRMDEDPEVMETDGISTPDDERNEVQESQTLDESMNKDTNMKDQTMDTTLNEEGQRSEETQRADTCSEKEEITETCPLERRLESIMLDTKAMPDNTSEAGAPESSEAFVAPESKLDISNTKTDNLNFQNSDLSQNFGASTALGVVPDTNPKLPEQKTSTPFQDGPQKTQTLDRSEANPLRSLGDLLKSWKERVNIVEEETQESETQELENGDKALENGMEYKYLSNDVDSNLQATGAATEDQARQSAELLKRRAMEEPDSELGAKPLDTEETKESDAVTKSPSENQPQVHPSKTITGDKGPRNIEMRHSLEEEVNQMGGKEKESFRNEFDADENFMESFVSLRVQNLDNAKTGENLDDGSSQDEEVILRREVEINLMDGINSVESAYVIWQKYEHLTSRLSQELTEQLRLILEPTLATKFQGDYRSGKRINMKKVIPYVASDFRKDKIWLRRTKPSKRQYQVVLAIDDSRSMSESHCGHMALEALITICRAMSQLEIGQMAVASFGERGNVRLLHSFDRPFTNDAGVQIISQFSFRQDNTIADEPVVDLLHFLTRMLDDASRDFTLPSGRNILQQLVLIIADGRFHEKESLRRVIHEAITRRQLLAFIILDNPRESLLEMQSVSFSKGAPTFSKYLDSFPFPYYILLKDVQSLPRTLANLLRQWFELIQQTS